LDVDDFEVPTWIDGSCDWSFHSHFDVAIANFNVPHTFDYQFLVDEICCKSWFLDVDERELENVNKGGHRGNKHAKLWGKNKFKEWKKFHGYDTKNLLYISLKMKRPLKDLWICWLFFCFRLQKKTALCTVLLGKSLNLSSCFLFFHFFHNFLLWSFNQSPFCTYCCPIFLFFVLVNNTFPNLLCCFVFIFFKVFIFGLGLKK